MKIVFLPLFVLCTFFFNTWNILNAQAQLCNETKFIVTESESCDLDQNSEDYMSKFFKLIENNISYPPSALAYDVECDIIVQFSIENNGEINNIQFWRKGYPLFDYQVYKALKSLNHQDLINLKRQGLEDYLVLDFIFSVDSSEINKNGKVGIYIPIAIVDQDKEAEAFLGFCSQPIINEFPGYDEIEDNSVLQYLHTRAEFIGGIQALKKWLIDNISYPVEAAIEKLEGTVIVKFVVLEDGGIGEISVIQGIDPLLDSEAIDIVKRMPKWIPATYCGTNVKDYFTLPISFKLTSNEVK